jgi:hypothetical protein
MCETLFPSPIEIKTSLYLFGAHAAAPPCLSNAFLSAMQMGKPKREDERANERVTHPAVCWSVSFLSIRPSFHFSHSPLPFSPSFHFPFVVRVIFHPQKKNPFLSSSPFRRHFLLQRVRAHTRLRTFFLSSFTLLIHSLYIWTNNSA